VDTITVRDPVNPSDAEIASEFAVEIVAANTVAGANSRLRDGGRPLPAATIAPVLLGSDRSRWYRVIVGAWRKRASADSLLGELRRTKRLGPTSGLVVRTPLAVWLGEVDGRDAARVSLTEWERRGFPAYALEQEDGRVRIYSGAFETSAAAALLADAIRAAGGTPTVAYRTGRTF
jgi:hypothetical protein